jgi:hypothetical protein
MDLSSLPQFPGILRLTHWAQGEGARSESCGATGLITRRLLFLGTVWSGVIVSHDRLAIPIPPPAPVKGAAILNGIWISSYGDGSIMEFGDGVFRLTRAERELMRGRWWLSGGDVSIWLATETRERQFVCAGSNPYDFEFSVKITPTDFVATGDRGFMAFWAQRLGLKESPPAGLLFKRLRY